MPLPPDPFLPVAPTLLPLIKALFLTTLMLHLPFVGAMMGGAAVSLALGRRGTGENRPQLLRLAGDLLYQTTLRRSSALLVLLTAVGALLCLSLAYGLDFLTGWAWLPMPVLLLTGLLLLFGYRRLLLTRKEVTAAGGMAGIAGLLALLGAYLLFFCGLALLLRPDLWPFLPGRPSLLLSWNGVAKLSVFAVLAPAVTGAALLLFGERAGRLGSQDPEHNRLTCRTGALLAAVALPLFPLALLFDLLTLPVTSRSPAIFALAALALLLALFACLLLLGFFLGRGSARGGALFAAVIGLFALWVLGGQTTIENVIPEGIPPQQVVAASTPPEPASPVLAGPGEREADMAPSGEAVFNRSCAGCHHFDTRLVGPPLDEILPAYRGRAEALESFIRKPRKVREDYPAMPALGLTDAEIAAVVHYLLAGDQ